MVHYGTQRKRERKTARAKGTSRIQNQNRLSTTYHEESNESNIERSILWNDWPC